MVENTNYSNSNNNRRSVIYKRYYGLPSSRELKSFAGDSIKNFQAVLDCLEAGESTYNERKRDYDLLKN